MILHLIGLQLNLWELQGNLKLWRPLLIRKLRLYRLKLRLYLTHLHT